MQKYFEDSVQKMNLQSSRAYTIDVTSPTR